MRNKLQLVIPHSSPWSEGREERRNGFPRFGAPSAGAAKLGCILLALILLCSAAFAQTVTGSVVNATTGKPATGVEVTLVEPMQGMAEVGKASTDAQGRFTIRSAQAAQGPRLVRATKDSVGYFKMLPPGSTNADLQVFDAAAKVDGITTTVDVVRLQSSGGTLQVTELYAVQNSSNPPRALAGQNTYEVMLPEGAQLSGASAQGPGGQPIQAVPQPLSQKNHYAFSYALKPGETRFQLAYTLPYNGTFSFTPQLPNNVQHYVVELPATMQWKPKKASAFQPMQDQPGAVVQVASNPKPEDVAFSVSGSGQIVEQQADDTQSAQGGAMGGNDNRPGGGLGAPIDAPDPLKKYRWWILGGLAVALGGGALFTLRRNPPDAASSAQAAVNSIGGASAPVAAVVSAPAAAQAQVLLAALKEELFQLELDRQQGKVSEDEYAKNKAALDLTLTRALSRGNS